MRIIILCMLLFTLLGCMPAQEYGTRLECETRESLQDFVKQNCTTHTEILHKLGRPESMGRYSDGRYSYIYTFSNFINPTSSLTTQINSQNTAKHKISVFIFSQDGILLNWKYNDNFSFMQRSKYENLMNAENSELYEQGKITSTQFNDLQNETQIGRVFGECGKPLHAQDVEGAERWIYGDADEPNKHYYLYFGPSGLERKYWIQKIPYQDTSGDTQHGL